MVVFRRLSDNDIDAAVAILAAAAEWLLARGIRQWTTTDPHKLRQELRDDGQRYGLFENDRLVCVVTLTSAPPEWDAELRGHDARWISKLAVAPDSHGRGLGRRMMEEALEQLRSEGARRAWLDCRNGPLVAFYEYLGFEQVTNKVVDFPTGPLDVVLMKKDL